MKIEKVEDFHADAGWRNFSFLKITTDDGLIGWSEYNESSWNRGLSGVVRKLGEFVIGKDPRQIGHLSSTLRAITRMAPGGINDQAIAAIENACLDVKAKALGVPVYELFGGSHRESLKLYWSHCGTFRVRNSDFFEKTIGTPPLRSLDDFVRLGKEVTERGYSAAKTNPVMFGKDGPKMFNPGFAPGLDFASNADGEIIAAISDQLAAFRQGLGSKASLMMDLNFSFRPEGLIRIAKAAEPFALTWLEMDLHDASALAGVRQSTSTPIASLEAIYGKRNYRPYFERSSVDVAIIDVPWNGMLESYKIACVADTFEVNVAPHNFYGHLSTMMSAHLCCAIPNFRIMEIEVDDVPWKDELFTSVPNVQDGNLIVSSAPGWGCDVNEEALRSHPAK
jgi:L-alanine-DL-glutamate epimerase-like enolase superfamily enzyme